MIINDYYYFEGYSGFSSKRTQEVHEYMVWMDGINSVWFNHSTKMGRQEFMDCIKAFFTTLSEWSDRPPALEAALDELDQVSWSEIADAWCDRRGVDVDTRCR